MPKEIAYLFDPNIGKYYYGKLYQVRNRKNLFSKFGPFKFADLQFVQNFASSLLLFIHYDCCDQKFIYLY